MASSEVSDVKIILLGKSLPNSSRVGNCILGKFVFETESTPHSVIQHSGRTGEPEDGRYITIIKAPHLHVPDLSLEELNQEVKQCALLSNPGPHGFLLVVQPHDFSEEDRTRLKYILNSYSEEALNYSTVISTDCRSDEVKSDAFHKLLDDCHGRHHRFTQLDKRDQNSVSQLLEEIDKMLKENGGDHLVCEIFEDAVEPIQLDKKSFSDFCEDEGIGTLTFIQHEVNTVL
ncbi:GTPase IMAP family member 9-like [Trichomycterus rosablanca]|uniref:GTPase IMAP family member 9-like n=1 Tax=Trichomycterus rosablanca TaxID=2290929 RepID=UPI002F34FD63